MEIWSEEEYIPLVNRNSSSIRAEALTNLLAHEQERINNDAAPENNEAVAIIILFLEYLSSSHV
jgi:hypothetical protein